MKLSIVVPVFNEEKTVLTTLKQLSDLNIPHVEKEIIIIDDGSTDNSVKKIKQANLKGLIVISHEKNKGKGAAVITGIQKATGEYILIQDADTEYNPSQIPSLLEPIKDKKANVVYGTRLNRLPHFAKEESHSLFIIHYLGNRFLSLITSLLYGQWITDMETCYKLFPKKALEHITLHARGFELEPEITAKLMKNGYKIFEVPITTVPRGYEEGKKLHTIRDGIKALWALIKYRIID